MVVYATKTGFEITQYGVDPIEFQQIFGVASAHDDGFGLAPGAGFGLEPQVKNYHFLIIFIAG